MEGHKNNNTSTPSSSSVTKLTTTTTASCQTCGGKEDLSRCSGCKSVWYCNKDCQKEDWKEHKNVCNLMGTTKPKNEHKGEHKHEPTTNKSNKQPKFLNDSGPSLTVKYSTNNRDNNNSIIKLKYNPELSTFEYTGSKGEFLSKIYNKLKEWYIIHQATFVNSLNCIFDDKSVDSAGRAFVMLECDYKNNTENTAKMFPVYSTRIESQPVLLTIASETVDNGEGYWTDAVGSPCCEKCDREYAVIMVKVGLSLWNLPDLVIVRVYDLKGLTPLEHFYDHGKGVWMGMVRGATRDGLVFVGSEGMIVKWREGM